MTHLDLNDTEADALTALLPTQSMTIGTPSRRAYGHRAQPPVAAGFIAAVDASGAISHRSALV